MVFAHNNYIENLARQYGRFYRPFAPRATTMSMEFLWFKPLASPTCDASQLCTERTISSHTRPVETFDVQ